MNTRAELVQAFDDYQAGRLGTLPAAHHTPEVVWSPRPGGRHDLRPAGCLGPDLQARRPSGMLMSSTRRTCSVGWMITTLVPASSALAASAGHGGRCCP